VGLGREPAVKQAEDAVLEREQLATDGRIPTALEGVFGLVVLLSLGKVASLRLTGVSGKDNSVKMNVYGDILAT
jgi:hypothetical protein